MAAGTWQPTEQRGDRGLRRDGRSVAWQSHGHPVDLEPGDTLTIRWDTVNGGNLGVDAAFQDRGQVTRLESQQQSLGHL